MIKVLLAAGLTALPCGLLLFGTRNVRQLTMIGVYFVLNAASIFSIIRLCLKFASKIPLSTLIMSGMLEYAICWTILYMFIRVVTHTTVLRTLKGCYSNIIKK